MPILNFGIKDLVDIILVALLLFYVFKLMRKSGTTSLFYGIFAFIILWIITSLVFDMRLTGMILDRFMSIGLLIIVILFQDQIKRFLVDLGTRSRLKGLKRIFGHDKDEKQNYSSEIRSIVYACNDMSKAKIGALIVIQRKVPLTEYERGGEMLDAKISSRLIENIFFKNSPLHDGAMIIADGRIKAAGCILPVSSDMDIPKELGLRHRSALGMSQATDALCIVVSEETGKISTAMDGKLNVNITSSELQSILSTVI